MDGRYVVVLIEGATGIHRIDSDQFVEPGADDGAPAAARLRTGAT